MIIDFNGNNGGGSGSGSTLPVYNLSKMSGDTLGTFFNWCVAEKNAKKNVLSEALITWFYGQGEDEGIRFDMQMVASSSYISEGENLVRFWAYYEAGYIMVSIYRQGEEGSYEYRMDVSYPTLGEVAYGVAEISNDENHTLSYGDWSWNYFFDSLDGSNKPLPPAMPVKLVVSGVTEEGAETAHTYYGLITAIDRQDPNVSLKVEIEVSGTTYIGLYSGERWSSENPIVCTSWTEKEQGGFKTFSLSSATTSGYVQTMYEWFKAEVEAGKDPMADCSISYYYVDGTHDPVYIKLTQNWYYDDELIFDGYYNQDDDHQYTFEMDYSYDSEGECWNINEPYLVRVNRPVWTGTQAEYDAIETKDENTIYLITD